MKDHGFVGTDMVIGAGAGAKGAGPRCSEALANGTRCPNRPLRGGKRCARCRADSPEGGMSFETMAAHLRELDG